MKERFESEFSPLSLTDNSQCATDFRLQNQAPVYQSAPTDRSWGIQTDICPNGINRFPSAERSIRYNIISFPRADPDKGHALSLCVFVFCSITNTM